MTSRYERHMCIAIPFMTSVLITLAGCGEGSSGSHEAAAVADAHGAAAAATAVADVIPPQTVDTLPRDSIADLPRASVDPRTPAPTGRTIRVGARDNLQNALNRAQPGDVVLLAPGATFEGPYTLPRKPCPGSGWITVRTEVPDSLLPAENQRITPAFASRLAKVTTDNSGPALRTANPTCGWKLMALEITASPKLDRNTVNYGLLLLGDGGWKAGGDDQTSLSKVPSRFVVDRVFLHGLDGTNTVRCLALNSAHTAVINSWIDDCHAKGFDSQAIEGWNGPGPYLIENNFLAGAGENVMFGGADPGIPNLVPSDITIRRNHVYKDPAWKGAWTVKNLFELKTGRRVLVEGNVFENNWADAQAGMAIVIKSSNDGGSGPWQGTTDLTFRYNLVRNSPRGFNVQAIDGAPAVPVARVRIEHNLFENIGRFNDTESSGWLNLVTHGVRDIAIRHNTMVHNVKDFGLALVMYYANGSARNLMIDDNVFTNPAGYAIFYSGTKVGVESIRAAAGSSWSFARNVAAGVSPEFAPWHPPESWYPATVDGIGFVDARSGDYRLAPRSQFKGRGKGGTDPGVDFARLTKAIEGVVVK